MKGPTVRHSRFAGPQTVSFAETKLDTKCVLQLVEASIHDTGSIVTGFADITTEEDRLPRFDTL